jgi:hypothetical protein
LVNFDSLAVQARDLIAEVGCAGVGIEQFTLRVMAHQRLKLVLTMDVG